MKKKTGKWIRHGRLAAMLFILGMLAVAVYGSFAAYTSFNSVKRVVSTGTQSDTMFSSNYLSLMNLSDENTPSRRISLADNNGTCTFTVLVCNYVWGDQSLYNPKNITYTVTAQLLAADGGSLPDGVDKITLNNKSFDADGELILGNESLASGSANSNTYKFELPTSLKDKIKIQMTAEPVKDSEEAVNYQKLGAIFSFADYEMSKNWTGHFLDSTTNTPDAYDAFNYEISGNGAGTVTVTWPESLQLSKWATGGTQQMSPYIFKITDESTTAIQFQFYRNPEKSSELTGKSWADLEKMVTVAFTEAKN